MCFSKIDHHKSFNNYQNSYYRGIEAVKFVNKAKNKKSEKGLIYVKSISKIQILHTATNDNIVLTNKLLTWHIAHKKLTGLNMCVTVPPSSNLKQWCYSTNLLSSTNVNPYVLFVSVHS